MCGRFTLRTPASQIADFFDLPDVPPLSPRYNIAPTQPILAIRGAGDRAREAVLVRWGLIPSWSADSSIGSKLINARSDSVAAKPSFRAAFRRRRCLIAADGFFEWQATTAGKQPYYLRLCGSGVFAFAGLWEHWQDPAGGAIESATIITTDANQLVRRLHTRMPVILPPKAFARWIDPHCEDTRELLALLQPYPEGDMSCEPVSRRVNNVKNDDASCIEPIPA